MTDLAPGAMSSSQHKCKQFSFFFSWKVFYNHNNDFRVFDEVLNNVNQIVQRQFSPLPETRSKIATRADTISSCSSTSECLINGSERKCWFGQCVECQSRDNQCVKDRKYRCNKETFQCEAGNYIGGFLTKELAEQKILEEVEKQEESVMKLKTDGVPNLAATMR